MGTRSRPSVNDPKTAMTPVMQAIVRSTLLSGLDLSNSSMAIAVQSMGEPRINTDPQLPSSPTLTRCALVKTATAHDKAWAIATNPTGWRNRRFIE